MSRDVTDTTRQAWQAEETDKAFVTLLTIDHADLGSPLRATDNEEQVTSNGEDFVPYAFDLTWPEDHESRPAQVQLRIGNVDRVIVQTLRSLATAPTVQIQLVRADAPDTIEAELPPFDLVEADYDAVVVEGHLSLESFEYEPYPNQRYTPATHPGLF